MNCNNRIYLCGPITGLTIKEASEYRDKIKEMFAETGILTLDPMRGKYHIESDEPICAVGYVSGSHDDKAIVKRDKHDVMNCALMLADFTNSKQISIGSMVEFGWADAMGIPIVTVLPKGNLHDHCFVRQLSTYVVEDIEEAVQLALTIIDI